MDGGAEQGENYPDFLDFFESMRNLESPKSDTEKKNINTRLPVKTND